MQGGFNCREGGSFPQNLINEVVSMNGEVGKFPQAFKQGLSEENG